MRVGKKILGISSGGFEGFSGVNNNMFSKISQKYEIDVFDNKLKGVWKYYNTLYCFLKTPGYEKFVQPYKEICNGEVAYYRFRTVQYAMRRTHEAEKLLNKKQNEYDLVLQTGWIPAVVEKRDVPRCIFTDYTMKLSEKEYKSWSIFLSEKEMKKWIEMETKSYKNADVIFTASDHTKQSLIEDYGVCLENVVTVYEGINLDDIPSKIKNYENNIILFVGIDFERKGGYVLIEAFKKVKKNINDAKLIILGSKPDINVDGVEVMGFVSHEEKMHYYNIASLFVMPSLAEPFGLVFLEAMANKIPCIGTNMSAMPEIIEDGETGYLVEPNNSDELADKIIFLLNNKNLIKKMGIESRKRVEKLFTWDKVFQRMDLEFNKLF